MSDSTSNAVADSVVSLEQDGETWWLVGPDGERFVTLGVNHIEPHLWMGEYNKEETLARYGEDFTMIYDTFNPYGEAAEVWIEHVVQTAKSLGFNSFGKHVGIYGAEGIPNQYYSDDIYYVASMDTAPIEGWKQVQDNAFKKYGPLPDPFSDEFEREVAHRVEQVCKKHRGNENLLGYFYADLAFWQFRPDEQHAFDEYTFVFPWANAIIQMDASAAGKQCWIETLQDRYESASEVADVYGTSADSWDALADANDWFGAEDDEQIRADLLELMKGAADRWYGLHQKYIRQYDEKHLILGDKLNYVPEWLFPFLGEYVDINLLQKYEPFELHAEKAQKMYEETGNPIINADGSFSVVREEQAHQGCKGYHVDTDEGVAQAYEDYLKESLTQSYMLGWHHCGMLEQWDSSGRGDIATSETGFLDPFEEEYTTITTAMKEANEQAADWHRTSAKIGGEADD